MRLAQGFKIAGSGLVLKWPLTPDNAFTTYLQLTEKVRCLLSWLSQLKPQSLPCLFCTSEPKKKRERERRANDIKVASEPS